MHMPRVNICACTCMQSQMCLLVWTPARHTLYVPILKETIAALVRFQEAVCTHAFRKLCTIIMAIQMYNYVFLQSLMCLL